MQRKRIGSRRKSLGQGMTEYIIIVALIAVAAIGTYSMFGKTVRNQTAGIVQELSGTGGQAAIQAAQGSSGEAAQRANINKGLGQYANQNDAGGANDNGGGGGNP